MQVFAAKASSHKESFALWRKSLLVLLPLLALIGIHFLDPIPQDQNLHRLADARALLGVPNFWNVISNLGFLIFGVAGLAFCLRHHGMENRTAWTTFFGGVALVCFASAYYHVVPNDATLVWDRAPITIAFMALFSAVVSEHVGSRLSRYLLLPAIVIGLASLEWWRHTDDLRFYIWVQAAPLLVIPLALSLFPARYTHRIYLLYGFGFYLLAKVAEYYDHELFEWTNQLVSGHVLKHVIASLAALCVLLMLQRRTPVFDNGA